jgi:hypothetical protein
VTPWRRIIYGYHVAGDMGVGGRIILKWILYKKDGRGWTGLIWLGKEKDTGCCEYGNEPSGYIKYEEFND